MADGGDGPQRHSALGAALAPRRLGPEGEDPGVWLRERGGLGIWQLAAWRAGEVATLRAGLAGRLGLDLPQGLDATSAGTLSALAVAPRRWWLVEEQGGEVGARLAELLAGRVALTELSHARSVLRLGGPASRSVLEGLCRIDLHPCALPPGRIAQTTLGQVPALIHAVDDRPCFDLYLPRSLAGSGLAAVVDAAAAWGIAIGAEALVPPDLERGAQQRHLPSSRGPVG